MRLKFGFSPCPNDTFMFDALINRKIDVADLEFEALIADIEQLNLTALRKEADIIKISYALYPQICKNYQLLTSGSALGNNCGPLLVCKKEMNFNMSDVSAYSVAIPGKNTTANRLLTVVFPQLRNKRELLFSEIEDAVACGKLDIGLIIHESRFTYETKGLKKIVDLGQYWESATDLPIPLGGIAIQRDLPMSVKKEVNDLIRQSILFAMSCNDGLSAFVTGNANTMDDDVMRKHIALYVNNYSVALGNKGKNAIYNFLNMNPKNGNPSELQIKIFIDS